MSYKVYEDEIVTFTLLEKDILIARSLTDVDINIDDKGIMLLDKNTKESLGHIVKTAGLDFEDFCKFFNLKNEGNIV